MNQFGLFAHASVHTRTVVQCQGLHERGRDSHLEPGPQTLVVDGRGRVRVRVRVRVGVGVRVRVRGTEWGPST